MLMNTSLRGAVAMVTGGASGIGFALGRELARLGADVVLADRDAVGLETTTAQLGASSTVLDVTDRGAFVRAVDDVVASCGKVDILVSCAGVSLGGWTHELRGAHWDHVLDVNLGGVVNGVLAAYPHMVQARRGHIVNVASGAGLVPPPFVVPYATAKHGVVGLSLGLRPEAALHGVSVTVVCPGAVETPILDRLPPETLPATPTPPVTARAYLETIGQSPISADAFARRVVRRVLKNEPIVVAPASARSLWLLHRVAPRTTQRVTRRLAAKVQRQLFAR
jgi:NAD(P)-dependent dehydrogenase (short-subunit alcohol dehydrogenase family)